jgi:hypothetical protein
MVLGQSSATAAVLAIDGQTSVQKVDIKKLQERLKADKQILEWTGSGGTNGITIKSLAGLVLDDDAMTRRGQWLPSSSIGGYVGTTYWHDNNEQKGEKEARFTGKAAKEGQYEVRLAYTPNPNRATNVPVKVEHAGGTTELKINQRQTPKIDKAFVSLGKFKLSPETPLTVTVSNKDTDGHVIVDAVWVVEVK